MTSDLQRTYNLLQSGEAFPACFHSLTEWLELYAITPLQIERDADNVLQIRAAVLDAGYIASGKHTVDSAADDLYFEESRDHMYKTERLQR